MEQLRRVEVFRLLLLLYWLVFGPVLAQLRHPLPVLWMMPISPGSGRENLTAALIPAVRMALQDLQKQPAPLGNYEIQLHLLDSQCDPAKSLKALFDAMWAGPKYLLLFGGGCPPVTALIARALPALGLVQVSFAAMPPSQSNRKWYGNLFSTMPSSRALNQAAVKLLQHYKWTRVSVVTQEGPSHSEMREDLMRQLLKADVQVVSTESLSDDTCGSLRKLKEGDVRIIIAQLEGDLASEVFCCAHTLDLFGAQYQWIVVGGAARWRPGWRLSGCTANNLLTAADGSLRVQIRQLSSTNTAGISGRTPEDYRDSYHRHLIREGSEVSPLHSFAYDAMWLAAKALTQVMEAVKHREKYRVQRNASIAEEEVQRSLLGALKSTRLEGVTGPVFFRNGERMTSVELIQIQGPNGVLVGEFNTSTQQLRLMNHLVKFKGRRPATDQVLVRLQHRHVSLFLYIVVSSAAAVIIFITLLILCLSIRRRWLLRSSCRSQDELLLLGIILSSSSVLISGLDGASVSDWMFEMFCSVRLWTLFVGHTLIFSGLFVKTWKMHSLVGADQKLQGRCPLLWLLLLDVFVLTAWQILDPLRRVVVHHSAESHSADPDVMIQPYSEHCSSSNMELWLTAVCGYKGPLLGLGCFLAWNTRCAQVANLSDSSKNLTLSMFAVTGFTVVGALGSMLAPPSRPVQFGLNSVVILCCSIFILSWTYGPSSFSCCCGDSEHEQEPPPPPPPPPEPQSDKDQLSRLNLQLNSRTAQLDVEIESIIRQLSETSEPEVLHTMRTKGEIRSVTSTDDRIWAQDQNSKLENVNSPERVQRRLSLQLPILHHSYLPVVGGVSSSSSSPFGSHEAFVGLDVLMTAVLSGPAENTRPRY